MPILRLHPFLSTFFPTYYSRISLHFDVIQSELQRTALYKSWAHFTSLSFLTFRAYFNLYFSIFAIFRLHYSTIPSFYFFILLIIYTIFSDFFFLPMQFTLVSGSANFISKKAFRLWIGNDENFWGIPQFSQEMTEQYFILVISQSTSHNVYKFYVHVTVHRNKFLYNKTKQKHQFPKFTPAWNSTCFGEFLCPSSGVYSLYTQQWYISYRFVDNFRAGPGWNSMEFHPGPARKLSSYLYDINQCRLYSE
jgi:hypothetical protein